MDEAASAKASESPSSSANPSLLTWLMASVVVTTALALAAAHAPPRIRLIGLFSIALGLIVGWLLERLAEKLEARPSLRTMGLAAAVLTFVGLIGSTWETARLETSRQPKSDKDALAARLLEQMKAQPNHAQSQTPLALTEFRRYLSWRIRQLGEWHSPWPEAFWCTELLAASLASIWISTRTQPRPPQTSNEGASGPP